MVKKRERRAKGEGTVRLRADGRYEGREPPETVPRGRSNAASTAARSARS